MAKFVDVFPDTLETFQRIIDAAGLREPVISVIANNTAKDITKVTKASDLLKFRTKDDVVIIVNEKIFEQLPADQQILVAEEAVSFISYDSENDKVVISQPDFTAHTGILRKYGFEVVEVLRESVKTLFQAAKDAEEENKNSTK
jgi:hypothetical protein